uniref:Nudix hydrolase domain-containing protein n=1 Tax=Haptolina brevifila TaxID=156173 RepID=A0A7S2FPM9_9EUKA
MWQFRARRPMLHTPFGHSSWAPPTKMAMAASSSGHTVKLNLEGDFLISGVRIAAAGVVPYVDLPGHGLRFMLQSNLNGTRAGKLSDFGGRREPSDVDAFYTAARELCEETDSIFGDALTLASRLRNEASVRILNPNGRYVCFFLKVASYLPAQMLSKVDVTAVDAAERDVRWWRADELLGSVELLERMVISSQSADSEAADGRQTLSSFQKAVCKTLALENAHPHAHERWHATIMPTIAAVERKR